MSKLRTYSTLKHNIVFEEYLISVKNVSNRIALTKFKLSNHTLMMETGRHENIHQTKRRCPFRPEDIENELHFMTKCPIYSNLRLSLLEKIGKIIIGFYHPNNNDKNLNFNDFVDRSFY